MGRTRYLLTNPDDVARYLEREGLEHTPAFERWRAERVSRGFQVFVVQHGADAQTPPSERGFDVPTMRGRRGFA